MKIQYKLFPIRIVIAAFISIAFPQFFAVASSSDVIRYELSNGMPLFVKPIPDKEVATIQVWVEVGSADETDEQRGISHVIEHMAFKGTERRPVGQVAKEVRDLGGSTNAYTSWDRTVYFVTVPAESVLQGMDVVTDAVFNAVIDPKELEKEKKVVLEEILEQKERPGRKSFNLLVDAAFTRSPYRFPVIGSSESVAGFTRDDIIEFREKWYVPANMFLVVVGDVDPEAVRVEAERLTAHLEPEGFFRPARASEPPQTTVRTVLERDDHARQTHLKMGFHVPSARGTDVNALDLAADILGARSSSRLVRVLKKEKGLVRSIETYSITPKHPGLFVVSATLDAADLEETVRTILTEIRKLAETPPSKEELERAKTAVESSEVFAVEKVGGSASRIGSLWINLNDPDYLDKYLLLNRAIAREAISEAVGKYLIPSNLTITALVPKDKAEGLTGARLAAVVDGFSVSVEEDKKKSRDGERLVRTLENGIRVVLKPDDSNPVVSFSVAGLGGKRAETPETQGIMNFIAKMLNKGAGDLDEIEIARRIEDMGGSISGYSNKDAFGINTRFVSRHLEEGLELLATVYADPTFPEDIIERERKLTLSAIRTVPDRPIQFTLRETIDELYKDHPYGFFIMGTEDSVSQFTREKLLKTYRAYAVPSNTVISGQGDFDPDEAFKIVKKLFGSIPDRSFKGLDVAPAEPPTGPRERIVRQPRAKAHLALGFRGTTIKEDDRYALAVLDTILGGMGGRLFSQLRDEQSLAYTVASINWPGLDRGPFMIYMGTDAAKVDRAVEGLYSEIERVKKAPVSEKELERAKRTIIGNKKIGLQTSSARAETIAKHTIYGLGYDYTPEFLSRISNVTADRVLEVARKYLDPSRAVLVKILPEKTEEITGNQGG